MADNSSFEIIIPSDVFSTDWTDPEDVVLFIADLAGLTLLGVPIGSIFGGLFGGGHAGSCGAFRDAYFDTVRDTEPVARQFNIDATTFMNAGAYNKLNHGIFIYNYLNFITGIQSIIDNGFEKYKGSNLLGQTMYHSRYNGWLFRNLIQPMLLHTNDWTWEWFRESGRRWDSQFAQSNYFNLNIVNLWKEIDRIKGDVARIPEILNRLEAVELSVNIIKWSDIPNIIYRINGLETMLTQTISPKLDKVVRDVNNIITNSLPLINSQIQSINVTINDIKKNYATKAELESVRTSLLTAIGNANKAITDLQLRVASIVNVNNQQQATINNLLQRVLTIEQKIPTLATKQEITNLQQQINSILIQLPDFIRRPEFNAYKQEVSQRFSQVDQQLQQLRNVDQQLQQQIATINQQIISQIVPTLVQHTQQIQVLEQQKIQTVLPTLQRLGEGLVEIDLRITREVITPTASITNTIINVFNTFINNFFPRLEDAVDSATDAIDKLGYEPDPVDFTIAAFDPLSISHSSASI